MTFVLKKYKLILILFLLIAVTAFLVLLINNREGNDMPVKGIYVNNPYDFPKETLIKSSALEKH